MAYPLTPGALQTAMLARSGGGVQQMLAQQPQQQPQFANAQQVQRQRDLAEAMMARGMNAQNPRTAMEGLGNLSQTLAGAYMQRRANRDDSANLERAIEGMSPEQQAFARANPDAFYQYQAGNVFPDEMEQARFSADRTDRAEDVEYRQSRASEDDRRYEQGFEYGQARDQRQDYVTDRNYSAGRQDRAQDVEYRDRSFDRGVVESDRTYGLQQSADQRDQASHDLQTQGPRVGQQSNSPYPPPQYNPAQGRSPAGQNTVLRAETEVVEEARAEAARLRGTAALTQEFVTIQDSPQGGSGGIVQNTPGVGDLNRMLDPEMNRMNAINSQIAPNMRPPGSGVTSDRDMAIYMRSTVDPRNTPEANRISNENQQAMAQAADQYAFFLQNYQADYGIGALTEARRLWDTYSRSQPVYDPETGSARLDRPSIDDWLSSNRPEYAAGGQVTEITDDAGFDALPSGARYRGPDGVERIKD